MFPWKSSLIAALLAVVITAGGIWQFKQSRRQEAHGLEWENNRLRLEASRRYEAQTSPASGPVSHESTVVETPDAPPKSETTHASKPTEYYRDDGNGTPQATLQTFAWACDRGDTQKVCELLYIDAGARPKAEAFMASIPEKARASWKTVDEMAAAILTRSVMASPFPNADILETATVEAIQEDRVRLRLPDVPRDGTEYQKTPTGWKYVLTEEVVDRYISRSRAEAQTKH